MIQSVRLVSFSKPSEDFSEELNDCQDLISFCARVSNPSNQLNTETTEKLLRYMIKYKHWSPFEMASACLEITTTRDIARQILRHRSFSFQEFSQRYADPVKELEFTTREARLQDSKNRQNSIEIENDPSIQDDVAKQELISEWNKLVSPNSQLKHINGRLKII
jgi:thymidylate synthase (FAD)